VSEYVSEYVRACVPACVSERASELVYCLILSTLRLKYLSVFNIHNFVNFYYM